MAEPKVITISSDLDIVAARMVARDTARSLGFGAIDQARIATAISELARNIYLYAGEGCVTVKEATNGLRRGIEVVCEIGRQVRMAVEDIGLADPAALPQCVAAQQAVHFMGLPEGALALAQAVVYLCQAPKSNAVYRAYGSVLKDVEETRNDPVPLHLRNAVTGLMQGLGYGRDYKYAHDYADAQVEQTHLPSNLADRRYYTPTQHGFEAEIAARLTWRNQPPAASDDSQAASPSGPPSTST